MAIDQLDRMTHPLSMDVDIITLDVVHEVLCSATFKEGYASTSVMGSQVHVQQDSTPYDIDQIFVGRTLGKIRSNDTSLLGSVVVWLAVSRGRRADVISVRL